MRNAEPEHFVAPVLAVVRPGDGGEEQVGVLHCYLFLIVQVSTAGSGSAFL
jgi:hypothetical protein